MTQKEELLRQLAEELDMEIVPRTLVADIETLVNYSYPEEERSFDEYLSDQGTVVDNEETLRIALETEYQGGHIFGPIARISKWLNERGEEEQGYDEREVDNE